MEKLIYLEVGSVVGWKGKKYKLVLDGKYMDCSYCDLYSECNELPFVCDVTERKDGEMCHFEEIGGAK